MTDTALVETCGVENDVVSDVVETAADLASAADSSQETEACWFSAIIRWRTSLIFSCNRVLLGNTKLCRI